jgi:hypothetical protein
MKTLPLVLVVAACASTSPTSPATGGTVPVATIPPRPDDVATVDGMMRAFYDVVNVAPDAPRQWDRDRTLYVPWLRFVGLGEGTGSSGGPHVWTHQQFVDDTEPLVRGGFREREIHRTTRVYGNIVHVDSTYESQIGLAEPYQHRRGVNSVELYWDGTRWWIVSVIWQSETPDHPIPPELLP